MNINFLKFYKFNLLFFVVLLFFGIFYLFFYRFNLGLEFVGGVELELSCVSTKFDFSLNNNIKNNKDIQIRNFVSKKNIQIKIKRNQYMYDNLIFLFKNLSFDKVRIVSIVYIGPEMTLSIIYNSFFAIFLSIFFMFVYLFFRFNLFFTFISVTILMNNIFYTFLFISFFDIELNLPVLAALFSIFGYAINDTIIILDRIRENLKINNFFNYFYLLNHSVNSTFSRTFSTSFSTLLVVYIIYFFGNYYLLGFSVVLFFGILVGTFSSLFLLPSFLYFFKMLK